MSNKTYAPYGADDDPFLTHPAGPGQGQWRAAESDYWDDGAAQPSPYGYDAAPPLGYQPPQQSPQQPRYAAQQAGYDRGAYAQPAYGQAPHDPGPYYQHSADPYGYDAAPQPLAPQPLAAQPAVSQPPPLQSGNFRPRVHPRAPMVAQPATFGAPQRPAAHPQAQPRSYAAHSAAAQMQDPDFAGQSYAQQHAGFSLAALQSGQWVQWAGAMCTVLAVVGAGYWGYKLAVRDAHGIPVVRAALGPLRLAPETPGGAVSAHQGLAVNDIPAMGTAAGVPDQITLAPQMADLAPEDTTLTEQGSFAAFAQVPAAPPTIDPAGAGQVETLAGASDKILAMPETGGSVLADLADLANSLPEDMPLTDAEAVERALEAALAEGGEVFADSTAAPAPAVIEPATQIADAAPEPASMSITNPIAVPAGEMDPTSIPIGTPMVQFGAFDTTDTARLEWAKMQTQFAELMAGKALVIEQAKSGGRDFFRLRAHGFDSSDDTRRFCAAILAENGTCLTVDQR